MVDIDRTELCQIAGTCISFEDFTQRLHELKGIDSFFQLPPASRKPQELDYANTDYILLEELKPNTQMTITDTDNNQFIFDILEEDNGAYVIVKFKNQHYYIYDDIYSGKNFEFTHTNNHKGFHIPVKSISIRQKTAIQKIQK